MNQLLWQRGKRTLLILLFANTALADSTTSPSSQPSTFPSTHPATMPATTQAAATRPTTAPATRPVALVLPATIPVVPAVMRKRAIPNPSEIARASKNVDEVFAQDSAAAKTADQKGKLSATLKQAGVDEKTDMPAKYVLLRRAVDLSIAAGDLQSALDGIDTVGTWFLIDVPREKLSAVNAVVKSPLLDPAVFVDQARPLANQALLADEYDLAKALDSRALIESHRTDDSKSAQAIIAHLKRVGLIQSAYIELKPALLTLKTKPDDPAANLKVAKFRCFLKGEWVAGLLLLAKGNDLNLKKLALDELKPDLDSAAQLSLADQWWVLAEKETGIPKIQIQTHAADFYAKNISTTSGLARATAEKRIGESDKSAFIKRPVDLFSLVDLNADVVRGDWKKHDGILSTDTRLQALLQFPYEPPEEYDFRIVFVRRNGNNNIDQICYAAGHSFRWVIGGSNNSHCEFDSIISPTPGSENPTMVTSDDWLKNGRQAVSIVKVRTTGVQAFLDGKLIDAWKTDFHDLKANGNMKLFFKDAVGLSTWDSSTDFLSAQIIEITGTGKLLR